MTAETPQSKAPTMRYEIRRLNTKYDKLSDRIGRLEKLIYVMIGVASTTPITALYNLIKDMGAQ